MTEAEFLARCADHLRAIRDDQRAIRELLERDAERRGARAREALEEGRTGHDIAGGDG